MSFWIKSALLNSLKVGDVYLNRKTGGTGIEKDWEFKIRKPFKDVMLSPQFRCVCTSSGITGGTALYIDIYF